MTHRNWTTTLVLAVAALIVTAVSTPVWALEDFEFTETKTFEVGDAPEIDIESVAGDVSYTATGGTQATVDIIIVIRARNEDEAGKIRKELQIKVEGKPGLLEASVKQRRDFSQWLEEFFGKSRMVSVSFHTHGPKGASGRLSSVSGNAEASGITGAMELSTVSGDVKAEDLGGRLQANSVSGSIVADNCGPARVETVSGDIAISRCGGSLKAQSVSGSVRASGVLEGADISTISGDVSLQAVKGDVATTTTSGQISIAQETGGFDLHSISGDIIARASDATGRLIAETVSGEVKVYVQPSRVGDVKLSSSSGDIHVEPGLRVEHHSRNQLTGRLGNGETTLDVSTASGDILLGEL